MVTVKSDRLRKPRRFSTPKSDGSRAVTRDRWFSAKLFFIWINKVRENLKFWYMYICITSFYTTLQYWRKYFIGYLIEELAPFTISTVTIYAYVDILSYQPISVLVRYISTRQFVSLHKWLNHRYMYAFRAISHH